MVRPHQWKDTFFTLLHRICSTQDINNYRPISFLRKISVVFERLIFNFIYARVRYQIKRQQHGFMKNRSIVDELLFYLWSIYRNRDWQADCLLVCFDLRKAFDKVQHYLLLMKLASFGFDSAFIELLESYLKLKKQS